MQCVIVVFPDHAHLFLHVECEAEIGSFCIKYNKFLDVPICASAYSHQKLLGAQRLSGSVHVWRLNGCRFEPHGRYCVVSLSKSY